MLKRRGKNCFYLHFVNFLKISLKLYNFLHSKVTCLDFTDIVANACLYTVQLV